MIRRIIGRLIWRVLMAAGRCLAAYLLERGMKMLKVNENGKEVSFWGALGKILLAGACSYGMSKMDNEETAWAPYRNQMMANMSITAFNFLGQQMMAQDEKAAAQQTTETAAQ